MQKSQRTPAKPRPGCLSIGLLLAFLGGCLLALLAGGFAAMLPTRAAQTFGPPAPGLDAARRLYYAFLLVRNEPALTTPLDPAGAPRPFQVLPGEGAASIAARLGSEGLVADPGALGIYWQYSGQDTSLQAGEFMLSPAMPALQIALALQDATPGHVRFGILPGWRLEEIAAAIPTSGLGFTPADFLAAAGQPAAFGSSIAFPPGASLEGFLYPDVYRLEREATPHQLIGLALQNFEQKITPEMTAAWAASGLDVYQAVTLASLVEREAILDEEMPRIASVFHNRLAAGMLLQSDPTAQYALGFNAGQNTWWTNPLSAADVQVDSPYNTYNYPGLPPGPIASPGLAALQAVAFPEDTPYIYFQAACDGSGAHNFAVTYDEHIQNSCP